MKYPAYPAYKESGVEWLGRIPEGWELLQLRHLAMCLDGRRIPLSGEERATKGGEYPYWGANGVVDYIDSFLFDEDLVLLGEDGAPFFDKSKPVAFLVSGKIWVNNHIHVLKVHDLVDASFFVCSLNCVDYGDFIEGSTREKLTQANMLSIRIPLPPLPTQKAIAAFLDAETARIHGLVKDYEELIVLLQEKRQALISHAVTRGLSELVSPDDPEFGEWAQPVKFRDSGVEWLGEIPEGWEIKKLKHVVTRLDFGVSVNSIDTPAEDDTIGVLKTSCVYGDFFSPCENKAVIESEVDRVKCSVKANTVIVTRMNTPALVGSCGYVHRDYPNLFLPDRMWQVSFRDEISEPKFFWYLIASSVTKSYFSVVATGTSDSMKNLTQGNFLDFPFALPSISEQQAIAAFLDKETAKMDMLIAEAQSAIELLKEHRSALITNAVTGKINVEGLA